MNGLLEILTNKYYMVSPDFLGGIRSVIQQNLNGHLPLETKEKVMGTRIPLSAVINAERYSAVTGKYISRYDTDNNDPYINLLYVDGPITRNGGACTYGSIEHRDMIFREADNDKCVGHVFLINTPGGSAWAKNDYQQAIEYAHSKKQPVIAFVDGMCASAGMYLAALCDERYYMHPKDEIGCIGVMAAFYTTADNSKNQYTDETYHELYDPESFDKNREFRDIANDENTQLLIDELTKLGVEFRADVQAACPNAKDEHLHGRVFDAEEVKGILMDGQKTIGEVFTRVIELSNSNGVPAGVSAYNQLQQTNKSNKSMEGKYKLIASFCGVDELVVTNEGTHLAVSLLDTLQERITELQADASLVPALKDNVSGLDAQIADKDALIADLQKQLDDTKASLGAKNTELEQLTGEMEERQRDLDAANQSVSDLQAQVEELTRTAGEQPDAGESPANNGTGMDQPSMVTSAPQYNPNLTPAENARIRREHEARLRKQIAGKTEL